MPGPSRGRMSGGDHACVREGRGPPAHLARRGGPRGGLVVLEGDGFVALHKVVERLAHRVPALPGPKVSPLLPASRRLDFYPPPKAPHLADLDRLQDARALQLLKHQLVAPLLGPLGPAPPPKHHGSTPITPRAAPFTNTKRPHRFGLMQRTKCGTVRVIFSRRSVSDMVKVLATVMTGRFAAAAVAPGSALPLPPRPPPPPCSARAILVTAKLPRLVICAAMKRSRTSGSRDSESSASTSADTVSRFFSSRPVVLYATCRRARGGKERRDLTFTSGGESAARRAPCPRSGRWRT